MRGAGSGIRVAVRLLVSGGLIAWVLSRAGVGEVVSSLSVVGPGVVFLVLLLQAANTVLKAWKWRTLLAADGIPASLGAATASYMVASFFNVFLPSSIGGDAVRAYEAHRISGRAAASVTSVVTDRLLGFAAVAAIGVVASLVLGSDGLAAEVRWGIAAAQAALLAGLGIGLATPLFERVLGAFDARGWSVPGMARTLEASLRAYRHRGVLLRLFLVSVVAQSLLVVAIIAMAGAIGLGAPWTAYFVVVPVVVVAEALPVSIYGIGVRDVSYAWLLAGWGVSTAEATALAVLYVLLTLLYALFGGAVFAFRRTRPHPGRENGT